MRDKFRKAMTIFFMPLLFFGVEVWYGHDLNFLVILKKVMEVFQF
jgi:hypothetical protein